MDPETGLDALRNVGIQAGRVTKIAADPLAGARVIPRSNWKENDPRAGSR